MRTSARFTSLLFAVSTIHAAAPASASTSRPSLAPTKPAQVSSAGVTVVNAFPANKGPGWKKLEFYDGAKLLGNITSGATRFAATNLTPGYHVFSVLAMDGDGITRTADPKLVIVRPLPL